MNYERLPPPTLAEATELVEATVAAFQTGIGEVRTAATVLRLLAIAQAWIADQKIATGGSDVPPEARSASNHRAAGGSHDCHRSSRTDRERSAEAKRLAYDCGITFDPLT